MIRARFGYCFLRNAARRYHYIRYIVIYEGALEVYYGGYQSAIVRHVQQQMLI